MIQEILTYIILAIALGIVIHKIVLIITHKSVSACSGCFQSKTGCKIAELKNAAHQKKVFSSISNK